METGKNNVLSVLQSSFLFCGLTLTELQNLAQKTRLYTYPSGQILIEEDIASERILYIVHGLVKIYKLTSDGKEFFIAIEKSGDYLGVMNLEDEVGHATVEALENTTVLVMYKKDLLELLRKNPMLWEKMYKITLDKLNELREVQAIRFGSDFVEKTYLFLTYISKFFPNSTITLSQEIIASIVGSTRPRVTQTLQELKKLKKIALSAKKITILT